MNNSNEPKRQAMSAVANVQPIASIGAAKLTAGISLYVAHIRQVERQAGTAPRKAKRDAIGREYE
jgi:hypothetical protein